MRQKRAKVYRKLMTMYQDTFGFRTPFQILCDASFCLEGTRTGLFTLSNTAKIMAKLVQESSTLMITQCCIKELYKLDQDAPDAIALSKTFSRRYCNHKEPLAGDQCIASVIGSENKTRYLVASQSDSLRSRLRRLPGVPLIHIKRAVLVCEPPSDATMSKKAEMEDASLHPQKRELPGGQEAEEAPPMKKRKGAKGPNPLSVKKKKVKEPLPRKSVNSGAERSTGPRPQQSDSEEGFADDGGVFNGVDDTNSDSGGEEVSQQPTPGVIDGQRKSRKRKRRKGGATAPIAPFPG
ncbi:hypothetical protein FRB94_012342 [Tulasnella sp. JGI-2019a]|nr:hypothetical protein FRB93_000742 [Tulasnella sp. JGI-2019a]KAG9009273.1 hypothetical protein FRB94_012342 [Tulasnella sp. JGI-2019a]KAG9033605.1 hypothetical protein FRB95_014593 [Tulasnella sp. JGI-2019a]